MRNLAGFEKKYEKEIVTIAKAEDVDLLEAREMLIYTCRQLDKGLHTEGAAMDFGRYLEEGFDFAGCLEDFMEAIQTAEATVA